MERSQVQARWPGTHRVPAAWRSGSDLGLPGDKRTDGTGTSDFGAQPRGYAVYVPE